MFLTKKKYYLFTFGNCFWGYENIVIKAKDENKAIKRFLQSDIQNKQLKKQYNSMGKKYKTIKDCVEDGYQVAEHEVFK